MAMVMGLKVDGLLEVLKKETSPNLGRLKGGDPKL